MLRDARQRGWLHAYQSVLPEQYTTYIGFEGQARGVWNYESLFVPGLLQTEDYAGPGVVFVEGVKRGRPGPEPR